MNTIGLISSFAFVLAVLLLSLFIHKRLGLSSAITRKITHIAVSNWWFILYYTMDRLSIALVGPIFFIGFNFLSYRYHLIPAMELKGNRKNLGTVYFPISLLILVILGYSDVIPLYAGGVGILVLGYGDGLAAVIGQTRGKHPIGRSKTMEGTAAMFIVSLIVIGLLSVLWLPALPNATVLLALVLLSSAVATAAELLSPWGVDNITVPVITAAVYYGLYAIL
jgi:phytol kinase